MTRRTLFISIAEYAALVLFCFVLMIVAYLFRGMTAPVSDKEFVAYRFAENLAIHQQLDYGSPEWKVTTFPVTPFVIGTIGRLLSNDTMSVLWLVSPLFIPFLLAIGAIFLTRLTGRRFLTGVLYVLVNAWQPALVPLLMLAFALAALDMARLRRWLLAGVLMALAILTEPAAAVLAILTLLLVIREKGSLIRYALPAFLIPVGVLLLMNLAVGGSAIFVSIVPGAVTISASVLSLVALARYRSLLQQHPYVVVLFAWSMILAAVSISKLEWPSAAVTAGIVAVVAITPLWVLAVIFAFVEFGWGWLTLGKPFNREHYLAPFGLANNSLLNVLDPLPGKSTIDGWPAWRSDKEIIGAWINANTGPQDTLATSEIGAISYYAQRPIIDFSGRFIPLSAVNEEFLRSDFFLHYAPDTIIVLKAPWKGQSVQWNNFPLTYTKAFEAGKYEVYRRVAIFTPLESHPTDLIFSGNLSRADLRLRGVGLAESAQPTNLVRVRLDWELSHAPSYEVIMTLKLVDAEGKVAASAENKYPTGRLPSGPVSTYHLIPLPGETKDGKLTLRVLVNIRNGDLDEKNVGSLLVRRGQ